MRARLAEFLLSLHPDKTKLIEFGRYAAANREKRGQTAAQANLVGRVGIEPTTKALKGPCSTN
jgi:hypothetical protein